VFGTVRGSSELVAVPIAALTGSDSYHLAIPDQPAERLQEKAAPDSIDRIPIDGFGLVLEILHHAGFGVAQGLHHGDLVPQRCDFVPQTLDPIRIIIHHIPSLLPKISRPGSVKSFFLLLQARGMNPAFARARN
jgi:hypothetical protein